MYKRISATAAKNNFGGLLEDVTALGRVDVVRHGRLIAVVLSPRVVEEMSRPQPERAPSQWGRTHMIPPEQARAARMIRPPRGFDEDEG